MHYEVLPLQHSTIAPSIGSLFGTSASREVLDKLNSNIDTSVIFGKSSPILEGYKKLTNYVRTAVDVVGDTIKRTLNVIENKNKVVAITQERHFNTIPSSMYEGILMCKPVKDLFEDGRIYGFGYACLPEEDVWGRLINNGKVEIHSDDKNKENLQFVWEWKSDDPVHTIEDIENMDTTRQFIEQFYEKELKKEMEDVRDVTNWPDYVKV